MDNLEEMSKSLKKYNLLRLNQEEMKYDHPSPTSIQGFLVRVNLPLQHDDSFVLNEEDPCDKSKTDVGLVDKLI